MSLFLMLSIFTSAIPIAVLSTSSVLSALVLKAHAAEAGFAPSSGMWTSPSNFFAGQEVRIHAIVFNNQYATLYGIVEFYNNDVLLGAVKVENVLKEEVKPVSIKWKALFGEQNFYARLKNVEASKDGEIQPISDAELGSKAEIKTSIFVDEDTDKDGIGDREDEDDDGDGLTDAQEATYGSNRKSADTDNDGLTDAQEAAGGTDLTLADSDRDGAADGVDKYPMDPSRSNDEQIKLAESAKAESAPVIGTAEIAEPKAEIQNTKIQRAEIEKTGAIKVAPSPEIGQGYPEQKEGEAETPEELEKIEEPPSLPKIIKREFGEKKITKEEREAAERFQLLYMSFGILIFLGFSLAFWLLYAKAKKNNL